MTLLLLFATLIYSAALLYIFLFSIGQLHLALIYQNKTKNKATSTTPLTNLPPVTIQLPVYNEKYVIERLLEATGRMNYPAEKLEIQILDDSTDETSQLIQRKVEELSSTQITITTIRRDDRQGFKAGALQHALPLTQGDYIAIFDADFVPDPNFLLNTIHSFSDPAIGAVQTRWGHLNQEYSVFTELQAYGLDAHFSIEQSARNISGSFINFNGTCGIWRKECITDAGGWSADTLTEDLDLSYRAQLKGWKFKYLENVVTPGELPVIMPAIKSQQYRWNKGGAEVAKKLFLKVLRSKLPLQTKLHAFFHLFNSSVFLASLIASVFSIPMLLVKVDVPALGWIFRGLFLIGLSSIASFFWIATKRFHAHPTKKFLTHFPGFLIIFMGLSFHNGIAVLEGLLGIKTPFIRTPKFNILGKKGTWKNNAYFIQKVSPLTFIEGLLCLYFMGGIGLGIYVKDPTLMIFHVMLAWGYGMVFLKTISPKTHE